jgi:signal transduction histidine kinase
MLFEPPDDNGRLALLCAYDRLQGGFLNDGQLAQAEVPMLSSAIRLGRTRAVPGNSGVTDFKALARLLNRTHTGDTLYVPVLSSAGSPMLAIVLLAVQDERDWSLEEQSLLGSFGRFLVYFLQQNHEMAEAAHELEHANQARRNAQEQAQLSLELNQKLRDQLAVLQEDNDEKAGRVASMAALVATGVAAQESFSKLHAEHEALKVELEELSKIDPEREQALEGELRLALEEVANMQETLFESEGQVARLKAALSDAPVSNQQLITIVDIAQDIRQPLVSVIGYTEFLLSESIGILGDKQRKYLERIRTSTERMSRLLDDLLTSTSPNGDLAHLDIKEVDLCAVLQRAAIQSGERLEERQIELQFDLPESELPVSADQLALQKIFNRLLDNAGTVTPAGGIVNMSAKLENPESDQGYVLVQVVDGGGGINNGDLARVFSYRPSDTPISGLGVNGVEWANIKSLVEVHGGRIWVDSEDERGATFSVLLPVAGSDIALPLGEALE